MTNITLIAACDNNNCIGKGNKLPWKIRSEMDHFLKRVAFKPLIMGRNTCLSLYKPINSAPNYVLTRDARFKREGFITVNSLQEMLDIMGDTEHCVVGGSSVYELFIGLAEVDPTINISAEISIIDTEVEDGDAFFPLDKFRGNDAFREMVIHSHSDNKHQWKVHSFYKKWQ